MPKHATRLLVAAAVVLSTLAVAATALTARAIQGEPMIFDFKDPKGVNGVAIILDSTLEPFVGTGTGIEGTLSFNPLDPTSATGTLTMPVTGIRMSNPRMSDVLHGGDWLDAEEHPTVTVALEKVESVRLRSDGSADLTIAVTVTVRESTHSMSIPVRATFLPGRAGDRMRGAEGDLLVLRTNFTIRRSDIDLRDDVGTDVVADSIQIIGNIVGIRSGG